MLDFLKSDVAYENFDNDVGANDPLKRLARGESISSVPSMEAKEVKATPLSEGSDTRPVVAKRVTQRTAPAKPIKVPPVKAPAPAPVKKPGEKVPASPAVAKKMVPTKATPKKLAPKVVTPSPVAEKAPAPSEKGGLGSLFVGGSRKSL